jgi:Ca-activated chloride channel family protein
MRSLLAASLFLALTATGAVALDGFAPFGRLALSFGYPSIAAPLLTDPHWRGVALYRLGRYDEAVTAFRAAGVRGYYDRGSALAQVGRYREAVEVYDAHIYRIPQDEDARINRALISDMIAVVGEGRALETGMSDALAPGEESAVIDEIAAALSRWENNGLRTFTGELVMANRQWLATLADEPGRYLKLRLAAEHERRLELGTALAPASDPW